MVDVGERVNFTRSTGALHLACLEEDERDPELEIRGAYQHRRNGTDKGGSDFSDQRAFDWCVDEFGYVPTVRALYELSDRARQAKDSYDAARARRRGVRMRGVN